MTTTPVHLPSPDRAECLRRGHGCVLAVTREEVAAHVGQLPDGLLAAGRREDGLMLLVFSDCWAVMPTAEAFTSALVDYVVAKRQTAASQRKAA